MEQKLVAVMNKSLDPGRAMNALAHMSIALGGKLDKEVLHLVDYYDANDNCYPSVSKRPFIILRANSNKIKHLDEQANVMNIDHVTFTEAMTVGSWEQQLERSKQIKRDDLNFFGIVMYGDYNVVDELTKKFSLFK